MPVSEKPSGTSSLARWLKWWNAPTVLKPLPLTLPINLTGRSWTSRCPGWERFPNARIIILSHHDLPEMREQALEVGACAFVSKENLWEINRTLETLSAKP